MSRQEEADRALPGGLDGLLEIMARLRDPQSGCPWDLEQDFRSIAPYTIEETYEVVDAIERGDAGCLRDELGDLLFQVVFHAQMAKECGWFGFPDVADAVCRKMVSRHPHVFADETMADAASQAEAWEQHKEKERPPGAGVLYGVPLALPALTRAVKLQKRAARVGFDWPDIRGVFAKVEEELEELRQETETATSRDALQEECGDLLFAAVNLARHAGIDPEQALRGANSKFERRFGEVEAQCQAAGRAVSETGSEMLECFWENAKQGETSR